MKSRTSEKTISEIFNKGIFRIPDYQRGYAWKNYELEKFWQDLMNLQEERFHYTGTISLEKTNGRDWHDAQKLIQARFSPYYIVDGQQRFTTVLLLLSVIINKNPIDLDRVRKIDYLKEQYFSTNDEMIFGYIKMDPNYELLKYELLNLSGGNFPIENAYAKNIVNAKKFFQDKIDLDLKNDQIKIRTIYDKLVNYLIFDLKTFDDESDIYTIFETMNKRGKPLSNLESLKNRLIFLSTIISEDETKKSELRKAISDSWKEIYKYLGKFPDDSRDIERDDLFLKDHWIMFFKFDKSEKEMYEKVLFDEVFTVNNIVTQTKLVGHGIDKVDYDFLMNYVINLKESIAVWYFIQNPLMQIAKNGMEKEIRQWLYRINYLGIKYFIPLLMAVFLKLNKTEIKDTGVLELLKAIEAYRFLMFTIPSYKKENTGSSSYYNLASSFHKGDDSIESVISNLNTTVYGTIVEGKEKLPPSYNLDNLYNDLSDYFNTLDGQGYRSWWGVNYILNEYEIYLRKEFMIFSDKNELIFHFEKKFLDDKDQLAKSLNKWDAFKRLPRTELIRNAFSLGNITLTNEESKSKSFSEKIPKYKNGYKIEQEIAKDYLDWTPETILERGMKILEFMEQRWNIKIGSPDNKRKLLFLDGKIK